MNIYLNSMEPIAILAIIVFSILLILIYYTRNNAPVLTQSHVNRIHYVLRSTTVPTETETNPSVNGEDV